MRSAAPRTTADILYNFHWVVPGEASRAMQAWAGGLGPFLKRRGIRAIINLRGRNDDLSWWKKETATAKAGGIAHLDAMLDSRKLPTREMLVRLVECFDIAPKPFMLKCSGGQDRTSFAAALYLIHRDGWQALETARAQFARFPYLHFPKMHQRWLKAFVEFARESAGERPLAAWIAESYTPEKLKAWLDSHGLEGSYSAVFTTPTRSPYQW
jgi:protein tyrosine/serine phosphatase